MLGTLFASRGTIMLAAGDEFGRSQQGNNNAYAQDNAITWLDWANRDLDLENYVAGLAALRRDCPELERLEFLKDADWYDLDGSLLTPEKWESGSLAGFEVHLPSGGKRIVIRIDRDKRQCSVSCA